jgi:uncharacterized membrane protein
LILFFILFRKKIGQRPEFGFLTVALICGSLISISEPRYYNVSWDEQIHYKNVEKIASNVVNNMHFRPNTIPFSYSIEEQNQLDSIVDSKYKEPKTKSSTEKLTYNRIGYIPSAVALAIGNFIHLPHHIIFIFGRWINLLVYGLIVFFAIRKFKSGKMIMSVVALLPTAIFLAANYNYDSWLTAFTLLGLAYLFSELQLPDKKITGREICIMIGAFVFGLGPKAIYFPLLFLLFLLKPRKFISPKRYKIFILAVSLSIIFVVSTFLVPLISKGPGKGDHRGGEAVNSTEQIKFILKEPVAYAKILGNFMISYINPKNAGGYTTFFAYVGSFKNYLFIIILIILAVVTLTDKNEYDEKSESWKNRLWVIAVYLATVALICTALYVSFTPVKSPSISGVQPRYLIPLTFPLLFILGSSRIKNRMNGNLYNLIIFSIMAFVLLKGTWDLIIKNYY